MMHLRTFGSSRIIPDHEPITSVISKELPSPICAKQLQPHKTTLWPGRSFAQQLSRISPVTKV